jgi:hypothetical protein
VKFTSEDVPQNRAYPIRLFLAYPDYAFICLSYQFIFDFKVVTSTGQGFHAAGDMGLKNILIQL